MVRSVSTELLLTALQEKEIRGEVPTAVSGLTDDSRKVTEGTLFVAVPGLRQDGRRFIAEALSRGAVGVVAEGEDPLPNSRTWRVLVPSSREALARLANVFFGQPSASLSVVGITGTNGKTTTSYLVASLFRRMGRKSGVIGTIQYEIGDQRQPASQTTPDAVRLEQLLAEMVEAGVGGVAMEVSSHSLALHRVDGVAFDVAVFTNLTQDHLDFHKSLDEYRRAKARLFRLLAESRKPRPHAVLNADDPSAGSMTAGLNVETLTYGLGTGAMVRSRRYQSGLDGISLEAETPEGSLNIRSPLIGEHNVYNLLGAAATGLALGMKVPAIAEALAQVTNVPGRFERVNAGQEFLVVVDYAHTPDALERVLSTARKLTRGRLGVVFGCGGDRDRGKRPLMGAIAARLADRVWITSDNPRSEDPLLIIDEIVQGVWAVCRPESRCAMISDRYTAIREALNWAQPSDTVVIAGKGHETYQIIGSDVLPFDDRAVARQILEERQKAQ
jgi:UDP-N-acetylmuramoyl-L-alanyl-D-glutamate--2,6-diaminopimelate ligase